MDFLELAKKRYSVRGYTDQKVEAEKLERILQAAHVAPTAANLQPVRLIVVQDGEGLGEAASPAAYPMARMFTGSSRSGSRKASRITSGLK